MNNKSRCISVSRAVTIPSNPSVLHPCHRSLCFVPAGLLFGPVHNNIDTTHTYLHCAGFLNEGSIWLILTTHTYEYSIYYMVARRPAETPGSELRIKLPVKPQCVVFHFSVLFWNARCECGRLLQFNHFISLLHDRILIHESRCQNFFLWRPNLKRNVWATGQKQNTYHIVMCIEIPSSLNWLTYYAMYYSALLQLMMILIID